MTAKRLWSVAAQCHVKEGELG